MEEKGDVIIYEGESGDTEIEVQLQDQTVWLTQSQMVELFRQTKQNISLHIRNIFNEKELDEGSVVKDTLTTAADGKKYKTKFFNLDVIISVGYRVKSPRGTQFRIWANRVLKEYLIEGYAIDKRKFQDQSRQLAELKQTVKLLGNVIENKPLNSDEATGLDRKSVV